MATLGSPLLSLVQQAQTDLGLPLSNYVIRAPDNTSRQMGGLATRVGQKIQRSRSWSFLTREFHVVVPPPVNTTGTLTSGSTTITGVPAPVVSALLPGFMVVSGGTSGAGAQTPGLMQATRLLTASGTTVTLDQPASASGTAVPIMFRQDSFSMPSDWLHVTNATGWDATMRWPTRGPQTPQERQWTRRGIVSTGPRRFFSEIGSGQPPTRTMRIWPPPSGSADSPAELVWEYASNSWAWSAGGNGQPTFFADSDTCVFPDHIMVLGLKAAFFSIKGFASDDLQAEFDTELRNFQAMDAGAQTLDMSRTNMYPILISPAAVPDASWPGPSSS